MLTSQEYKVLSQSVYWIDEKHNDYESLLKEGKNFKKGNFEYKILKTKDNTSNGMQAMAVAPVKDGEADTSEVIIAYAGTNFDDKNLYRFA